MVSYNSHHCNHWKINHYHHHHLLKKMGPRTGSKRRKTFSIDSKITSQSWLRKQVRVPPAWTTIIRMKRRREASTSPMYLTARQLLIKMQRLRKRLKIWSHECWNSNSCLPKYLIQCKQLEPKLGRSDKLKKTTNNMQIKARLAKFKSIMH
jgi:hypothetical protein